MTKLSFEQHLHNALGSQEIENTKARHALWHSMGYSKEEWDNIGYKGGNTTWGHFFGRMVGWEEMWSGSLIDSDADMYTRFTPKCREDMEFSHFDLRAIGTNSCHNLAFPVIEEAEDGMSARACYLTPGQLCLGGEFTLHSTATSSMSGMAQILCMIRKQNTGFISMNRCVRT